jgi:hypothetical protein
VVDIAVAVAAVTSAMETRATFAFIDASSVAVAGRALLGGRFNPGFR